eukprot:TRINITY_DN2979_c0_g1_i1.p1 TRINITY_DN2979_c0_g1~~TRINITY_DN2979_c0_g1_i1.p1  ORF type:complete len:319 (-),score=49.61 TRINITY_DN2979_c0_g1_i1:18-974(-)
MVSDGTCLKGLTENNCYVIGGTFIVGGSCSLYENRHACYFDEEDFRNCVLRSEEDCYELSGNPEWVNNTECPKDKFACCYENSCEITTSQNCGIFREFKYNATTCDICSEENSFFPCCTSYGICAEGIRNRTCSINFSGKSLEGDSCPAGGVCGNSVRFEKTEFIHAAPLLVKVPMTVKDSKVSLDTLNISSTVNISNSNIDLVNFYATENSTVRLDGLSNISVGGCVEIGGKIEIELDSFDFDEEYNQDIVSFECYEGNIPSYLVVIDGTDSTSCFDLSQKTKSLSLTFHLDNCDQGDTSGIYPLEISLLFLVNIMF